MLGGSGTTKVLAVAGAILVATPLVATLGLSAAGSLAEGAMRVDWLMPAEFFPAALLGGALLFAAAVRARSRQALIGWSTGVMVVTLLGGQLLAVALGWASGERVPTGPAVPLVIGALGVYVAALAVVNVGGILLLRELFGGRQAPDAGASG